jgi:2-oxoisovalerate dehydrogenase E1 component alpha subunit
VYSRGVTNSGVSAAPDPVARSGLTPARLLEIYRLMALARALDERAWILNRSGRVHFVISGQGHEGAQVALCLRRSGRATTGWFRTTARVAVT